MTATSPTERSRQHRARQSAKATAQAKRVEELEECLYKIKSAWHPKINPNGWRVVSGEYDPAGWARQALEGSAKV